MKKNNRLIGMLILDIIISFFVMISILYCKGYAPFGIKSFATMDGNIQYLDFFAYLKDVMNGKNSIGYTFSKTLGGNNIAVFSYYLSSPWNVLLFFFDKASIPAFFNITVIAKMACASAAFSYFLFRRFHLKKQPSYQYLLALSLSLGYGFCQYMMGQNSNIMWLDGVYMLPFIFLGVYNILHGGRLWHLSLPVMLSILFNWYSGGINCLFACIWWAFELLLLLCEGNDLEDFKKNNLRNKEIWKSAFRFAAAMSMGVLGSFVLFLPTVFALQGNTKGKLALGLFKNFGFHGPVWNALLNYHYGARSSFEQVCLFCGTLALLGAFSRILTRKITNIKRFVYLLLFSTTILIFYWNTPYVFFSLFKGVDSYWYRYSYGGCALIIFLAASFLFDDAENNNIEKQWRYSPIAAAVLICLGQWILNQRTPVNNSKNLYLFMAAVLLIAFLLQVLYSGKEALRTIMSVGILVLTIVELGYNTVQELSIYHADNAETWAQYVKEAEPLFEQIRENDDSFYRINQTSTRQEGKNHLTANYNEAFAYNYKSIAGYTSSPDDIQMEFLDRVGYRRNGDTFCINNTSILGIDSVLGVKYVLSKRNLKGFEKQTGFSTLSGKEVYENPYVLPFAFKYTDNPKIQELSFDQGRNPFVYQNLLLRALSGVDKEIYEPLLKENIQKGDIASDRSFSVDLILPEDAADNPDKYVYYGNLPWGQDMNAMLNVNGAYETGYACWTAPSVFDIPEKEGDTYLNVSLHAERAYDILDTQFYALNLDNLHKVTEAIKQRDPVDIQYRNGYVKAHCNASLGERLFISIPYDKGWNIKVNGKSLPMKLVGNCMYSIPLEAGDNIVELKYHVSGLLAGILISIVALVGMILIDWREKR